MFAAQLNEVFFQMRCGILRFLETFISAKILLDSVILYESRD
jgi:hypothetical protein